MTTQNPKREFDLQRLLTSITTVIGILTALFSLYLSLKFGAELKELERKSIEIDNEIKSTQFVDKRVKDSYDLVLDAVKSKDSIRMSAAFHLITFTLADTIYNDLYKGLISLIDESSNKGSELGLTVKSVLIFESESLKLKQEVTNKGVIKVDKNPTRVDFFVLENSDFSSEEQDRVISLLGTVGYKARARDLPKVINNRPGYNLTKNEIRHEASELEQAKKVQQLLKSKFDLDFELNETSYPTSNYISVFYVR